MKKLSLLIVFLLVVQLGWSQSEKPKLVVGIVVDQMRQDYIYRYWDTYGNVGFKRLINDGYMLKNAHYNYVPTSTGPGHASIYSGTTPSNHGVIGNSWYQKKTGEYVNCVGDPGVTTIGADNDRGKASPHRLVASTVTDELKLASQGRSKVVSVSIKDRGSILPAGHMADGAYWFDAATGNFVSSTWYMEELPKWAEKFNNRKLAQAYAKETWDLALDKSMYTASGPDDSPYEAVLGGKDKPVFPYVLSEMIGKDDGFGLVSTTPYGNQIVTEMALAALEGEALGTGNETDFLAISYSSPDYAGHAWGPNAIEVQDMYIRLDRNLADLLKKLDDQVGAGNYTVFLTADHGVVDVPANLRAKKVPAGYMRGSLTAALNQSLQQVYGKSNLVKSMSNGQVFLDHSQLGQQVDEVADYVASYLRSASKVYLAYSAKEMRAADYDEGGMKGILKRGYHQSRSGDVVYTMYPAHSSSSSNKGTGHGTGFTYDTHIPMLWYGNGIKQGSSVEFYVIPDIAPTLSMLLNIRLPNASTGQPIGEVLK